MRDALLIVVFVLLLRLPFLDQAIQGDDVNYLAAAQYAQVNPAHPGHVRFIFQGTPVTMQGHPHPPGNAWFQATLLAIRKDIREVEYHAAYVLFSLIAAFSCLALARRFTPHPLLATGLFLATPAFVVNGNSLESDLPFVAFWLAATALFVKAVDSGSMARLAAAASVMALAAMTAFQSVLLPPILAAYLWSARRGWKPAWASLSVIPLVLIGWQAFEAISSSQLPAQVLAGHFDTYNLHSLENKLKNAAALGAHAGWLLFPLLTLAAFLRRPFWELAIVPLALWVDPNPLFWASLLAGIVLIARIVALRRDFLAAWIAVFFAAALFLFFAGSARYLLPIAAPAAMVITVHLQGRTKLLAAGFAVQCALSIVLALVNYQHWDGYREAIRRYARDWKGKRVWVNGEWGLRFYAESAGALPLVRGQAVRPGDMVLTSRLALPVPFTTGGGVLSPLDQTYITSALPLRLIGLDSKSAYSTASSGFRPFDISTAPIDVLKLEAVAARPPALSFLPMNAPEADSQIVSGIDSLEDNRFRWMAGRAVVLLKRPDTALPLELELFIPDVAPARKVSLTIDGLSAAEATYASPGAYRLVSSPQPAGTGAVTVVIEVDRTFSVPGDHRTLGVILTGVGFR